MPAGDYYLNKFNGSSIDEKVFNAQAGLALGFDASLNPVMLSIVSDTGLTDNFLPKKAPLSPGIIDSRFFDDGDNILVGSAITDGYNMMLFGNGNEAHADSDVILGASNYIDGQFDFIVGYNSVIEGNNNILFGASSNMGCTNSALIGGYGGVYGNDSVVVGYANYSYGASNFIIGSNCTTTGAGDMAFGNGAKVASDRLSSMMIAIGDCGNLATLEADNVLAIIGQDDIPNPFMVGINTFAPSYTLDVNGQICGTVINSTELTTAPFIVASQIQVINLNADLLDNYHASAFAMAWHTHPYEPLLGNPTSNGYILSSTTSGTRSWIANTGHNAVTIDTANGLSLSTQVLSLAAATTSLTGALTSTDWNTFNNKVSFPGFGTNHITAAYGDHTHSTYIDFVSTQNDILGTKVFGSSAMGGLSHNSVIGTKGTTLRGIKAISFNENLLGNIDIRTGYTISAPNTTTFTGNVNSLFNGNTGSGIKILTSVINDTTPFILEVTGPTGFMSYMYFGSFFNFIETEGYTSAFTNGNPSFTSWKLEIKSAQDELWYTLIDRTGVIDKVNNLTLSGFSSTSAFFLAGGRSGSGFRLTVRAGNPYVAVTYPQIYLSGLAYFSDGAVTESGNLVSQRGGSIYGNLGIGGYLSVTGNTSISAMTKSGTAVVTNLNADLLDGQHGSYYAAASTAHNPVTIGTANGLSISVQTLSMATASTSVTGALTSTDWNTFNNKVSFPGFGTNHITAAYGDHTHSNYDNYNQWTFQPENFAGSGASYTINSGYFVKLKAGTGMDLSHSIVGSTVTVTLTSSGGFPGFGTTHTTAAYGDHTHSNYDNYNQWTVKAFNGTWESKSVFSGQEITFMPGANTEWDTADLAVDGILVLNVINIPNIVLTGYTAGSTGLVAATDSLKVALSKLQTQASSIVPLIDYYSYTTYTGSGATVTPYTFSLPANSLTTNGQKLRIVYSGNLSVSTSMTFKWDTYSHSTGTLIGDFSIVIEFIRQTSSDVRYILTYHSSNGYFTTRGWYALANFTVSNVIKLDCILATGTVLTTNNGYITKINNA